MNRLSWILVALLTVPMTGAVAAASTSNFSAVVDRPDLRKNTKLLVREYWKSIRDRQVSRSGEALDVQGGAGWRVKILVADKSRPLYKGCNTVVVGTDVERAAQLSQGRRAWFAGALHDHNAERADAVIEVVDAQWQ